MPSADLTIGLRADRITPYLRGDGFRTSDLVTLAQALYDDPRNDLLEALRELGRIASANPSDGEIDDLIDDVETIAGMDRAEIDLSRAELDQLAREAAGAVDRLTPKGVPSQREAGAA